VAPPPGILADWRFLAPIPRHGRALVMGGAIPDLDSVFEVTSVSGFDALPADGGSFQLVVVCCPLEEGDSLRALENQVDSQGGMVVVFLPPLRTGGSRRSIGGQISSSRRALAGTSFDIEQVYGALPDPWVPELVFPLTPTATRYGLRRFVLSRRPTWGWVRPALSTLPLAAITRWGLRGALVVCRRREAGP